MSEVAWRDAQKWQGSPRRGYYGMEEDVAASLSFNNNSDLSFFSPRSGVSQLSRAQLQTKKKSSPRGLRASKNRGKMRRKKKGGKTKKRGGGVLRE